ncbi:transcriptional regulator [Bacillus pseudomycoides]|uniref:RsfA family transcriptional regulator n=1 Tax=Bacillus pseudomycoides TaxID=64104 RepID=UPI000BF1C170|nr:RsfA family transcriptional regulator [Bacillus pseudomycoides]MBD5795467.1 transcriptional regulator [Bacillus pseudomycoides]MED1473687.1 RsfA family transcriptional regulator [Bacillus pseudomycoides]MED1622099.1 RsfA family transcriptional regulator [Bacillus pseudomycoides]PEJ26637.1 RsfA family transcriptional regulator [Bacillus pseudomycoides]PEO84634.1 RsfA family transcriptional regulator [Bacillus pseudomycoides]
MKVRQDAWTDEDDLLLAETVLRHVREGSTQLNAFEEVGDQLNRTSAACGFRWNAVVRYSYEQALQLAKRHRKDKMRAASGEHAKKRLLYTPSASAVITVDEEPVVNNTVPRSEPAVSSTSITIQDVIYFLQTIGSSSVKVTALENENVRLKQEIKAQMLRNEELEKKLEKLEQQSNTVQEDYETLMNIMNRARKLALMDDEEQTQTSFRMDRNGNLEKIAE